MGQRKDVMLCYPFSRNRLNKWDWYYAQPKLNGLRGRAKLQPSGKVKLYSSEGHVVESIPHINKILEEHWPSSIDHLDGEFYKHGLPLQDIRSIVGRKPENMHPEHEVIEYWIFDSISEHKQTDRLAHLFNLPLKGKIRRVQTEYGKGETFFEPYLIDWMAQGFEGAVLRKDGNNYEATTPTGKRSLDMMKIKPRSEDIYVILKLNQEEDIYGQPKNAVGSFTCVDADGEVFNVGGGPCLTRANRILYWRNPSLVCGKLLRVRYPELTNRGVPRSGVAMEVLD